MPFKASRPASSRGLTVLTRTSSVCRSRACATCSQRFQVLGQIAHLRVAQSKVEHLVVVLHDGEQRGIAAVVIEAPLLPRPDTAQRRRTVAMVRRPVGLEAVDADLV